MSDADCISGREPRSVAANLPLAVLIEHRLVTDGRTDGRTHRHTARHSP